MIAQISHLHVKANLRDYEEVTRRVNQGVVHEQEKTLGNMFEFQSVEFLDATRKMIECLSPVLDIYINLLDLVHLKDPFRSSLFFIVISLAILHLEAVLSLALLGILLAIQYNAYYRREYQPYDVKYVRNAQFLLQIMNLITESIAIADGFVRDVIYWGNPAQSVLMMNIALFGSIILYLSLIFLPLRQLTIIALGCAVLRNSEFFNTLGLSVL